MRYGRIVWCITAALLVALVLNLRPSQLPPSDGVATGAGGEHQAATWHQLGAALGWSMISGLATGVGGAVVFFLEDDAGVSSWLNAFLLGLAVGVMMLLSIADMIVPNVLKYGLLTGAPPIGAGVLLIYLLDCLIDRFGLGGGTGGFPVGASPGLPAPAASPGRSKKTASGSSNSDGAGRLRSDLRHRRWRGPGGGDRHGRRRGVRELELRLRGDTVDVVRLARRPRDLYMTCLES